MRNLRSVSRRISSEDLDRGRKPFIIPSMNDTGSSKALGMGLRLERLIDKSPIGSGFLNEAMSRSSFLSTRLVENAQGGGMVETKSERLDSLLADLQRSIGSVEASAIVSADGLIISSRLPPGIEEDRIAAMTAAMLGLGEKTAQEMGRGGFNQVFVRGPKGYVVIMSAGQDAVLTVVTNEDVKLGLLFIEMKRYAREIGSVISE
jgi:hypothetical protein